MSFANAILLAGGLLVAIPVILHLIMRKQPKHQLFPALRFLKQREDANRRRLRFRHWLLLAARCAAICLLAAALARPRIQPETTQLVALLGAVGALVLVVVLALAMVLVGRRNKTALVTMGASAGVLLLVGIVILSWLRGNDEGIAIGSEAPVAAALVFDTSPRMQYRQQNKTRIEAAAETGLWLLSQLPEESEIAVLNSRADLSAFPIDRGAARKRIKTLKATAAAQSLPVVVDEAIRQIQKSELARKEVFVFTDMARVAWPSEVAASLQKRADEIPELRVYIFDVGARDPTNFALGDLRLSSQTVTGGGELTIEADVSHLGPGGKRTVELHLDTPKIDGVEQPSRVRDRQIVELGTAEAQRLNFRLRGMEVGTHQGFIQIVGQDGLAWDDKRYFSIQVREAWPLLVVAAEPANDKAYFLVQAIAPDELQRRGESRFAPVIVGFNELSRETLASYAAVCVLDPPPLDDGAWKQLSDYARGGGSVAVFLGRNAATNVEAFNGPGPQQLLPAKLLRTWRNPPDAAKRRRPPDPRRSAPGRCPRPAASGSVKIAGC